MYAGGSKLNKDGRNGSYAKWTAVVCLAIIVICGAVKSMHLDSAEVIRPDAGLISLNEEGSISSSADGEKYRSECIYTIPEDMDEGMMLSVESRQDYLKVTLDGEVLLTNDDREQVFALLQRRAVLFDRVPHRIFSGPAFQGDQGECGSRGV